MSVRSRRFSGGATAARRARRAVREALDGELSERRLVDVELLVSELVTNSVRHAGCDEAGELSMEAAVSDECVHVRLCDAGRGFDERVPVVPEPDRAGGYGLVLLDRLSDRWGVQRNARFCVWFEVERAQHS
ncbi:MAG: ATP-binding protein [Solirubrobacteraceae bacterium]